MKTLPLHYGRPHFPFRIGGGGLLAFLMVLLLSGCHSSRYLDRYGDLSQIPNEPRVGQVPPAQPPAHTSRNAAARAANALGITYSRHDNKALLEACADWLGVPYAYGGNTKKGVDCSGFTCYIYNKVYGKRLHRRSRDQYGKDVRRKKKSHLRQGDLVFFTSPKSRGECSHVGIYLKENKFVHASSSRGVVVDRLEGSYWQRNWLSGGEVK